MSIEVYLSACSSESERVAPIADKLLRSGLVSIEDQWWWEAPTFTGRDHEHAPDERRRITRHHLANIEACNVFWMLAPSRGHYTRMGWAELGYAQAQSRALTIVVSGEFATASVCTSLSDRIFTSDEEALAYVLGIARRS